MATSIEHGYGNFFLVFDDTVSPEPVAKMIVPDDHRDIPEFIWLMQDLDAERKARIMDRAIKRL